MCPVVRTMYDLYICKVYMILLSYPNDSLTWKQNTDETMIDTCSCTVHNSMHSWAYLEMLCSIACNGVMAVEATELNEGQEI